MIASHNLKEVEDLADHIAIIHEGGIKAVGALSELTALAGFHGPVDLDTVFEYFTHG